MDTTAAMSNANITDARRREEFSDLLQRHCGIVFKVANTYARGNQDRADLTQEIAAQLRAMAQLQEVQRFEQD